MHVVFLPLWIVVIKLILHQPNALAPLIASAARNDGISSSGSTITLSSSEICTSTIVPRMSLFLTHILITNLWIYNWFYWFFSFCFLIHSIHWHFYINIFVFTVPLQRKGATRRRRTKKVKFCVICSSYIVESFIE